MDYIEASKEREKYLILKDKFLLNSPEWIINDIVILPLEQDTLLAYTGHISMWGFKEWIACIFHGMKMPILKAFHMIFRLTAKKKGMSTTELGGEVGVQQKTAWLFKRKVQVAMKQDNNDKLKGNVDADETIVGGYTNKNKGRSLDSKEAILLATEKLADGRTGNIRMQQIENFEALTLKFALKDMIDKAASITTDHHRSYQNLQKEMNLQTVKSNMGQSLEDLHKQIMQFKNWLRGIHHKCAKQHLFAYADEYVFRFNRRNNRKTIFHKVVDKMMNQIPHPYPLLKTLYPYST